MVKLKDYIVPMEKLRERRCRRGLTIEELAKLAGVSKNTIVNYENGYFRPQKGKLEQIAKALGCTVEDLKELPEA